MVGTRITIYMENHNYGKAMAKGLCYINTGLDVFLADSLENALDGVRTGILLTDCEVKDDPRIIKITNEEKLKPLDFIVGKIRLVFKTAWKTEIGISNATNSTTFGVYSKLGGRGVTSFAMTLARIISIKTDRNVLYLSLDTVDDAQKYINHRDAFRPSREEYFFMKEKYLDVNIKDYLIEDQWGVNYFIPESKQNFFETTHARDKILDYIKSENFFDYIIIDFGKTYTIDYKEIDKKIELLGENLMKDLSKPSVDNILKVINFSDYCNESEGYFYLKNYEESFVDVGDFVEISMEGGYAQAVENFVDVNEFIWIEQERAIRIMSE